MIRTKRPRCAACTRAKRKCSISAESSSCEACVKRGLECILDPVKIIAYKGPRKSGNVQLNVIKSENITSSSLVGMLTDAAGSAVDHERHADEFLYALSPKVYLPRQTISKSTDQRETPMLIDETEERVFDEETKIPKEFSLNDFVLSSLRVRSLKQQPQVLKSMSLSNAKGERGIQETLENSGYSVKHHPPVTIVDDLFKTFEEVNIVLDTENLSDSYYVKEPGVQLSSDNQIEIVNINEQLLPRHFSELLFDKFVQSQMQQPSTPLPQDAVPALQICLPLVFGNVTVLECSIVLSYYNSPDPSLSQLSQSIEALHLHLFSELQIRVRHTSTLCCDHTILLILYLLQIEVLKGARTRLYQHLIQLTHCLVTYRGGPKRMAETLTGECLFVLLAPHLANATIGVRDENSFVSWKNFHSFLSSNVKVDVFDNVQFAGEHRFADLKEVVKCYAHVNQLGNLLSVTYSANTDSNDGMVFDGRYDSLAGEHLLEVLKEADVVETNLRRLVSGYVRSNELKDLQRLFAIESAILYLYRTVHHNVAFNSRCMVLVKSLLEQARVIFDKLEQLSTDELREVRVFPRALLTLGVSLIGHENRVWLLERIRRLFELIEKENINTLIALMEAVWEMDPTGATFVDVRHIASQRGFTVCLYL